LSEGQRAKKVIGRLPARTGDRTMWWVKPRNVSPSPPTSR
jgi:hypothetical protein